MADQAGDRLGESAGRGAAVAQDAVDLRQRHGHRGPRTRWAPGQSLDCAPLLWRGARQRDRTGQRTAGF
jgi:hypothetical protein